MDMFINNHLRYSKTYKEQEARRNRLIRRLFNYYKKELQAEGLPIKLMIQNKGNMYGSSRAHYIFQYYGNYTGRVAKVILNIRAIDQRIKEGYGEDYYKGRNIRLAFVLHNRHICLRFILLHELAHCISYLRGNLNRINHKDHSHEVYADSFALEHLKIKDQTRQPEVQTRPQTRPEEAEVIRLYNAGNGTSQIARILNIKDPRSVRYILTKNGIKLRSPKNVQISQQAQ